MIFKTSLLAFVGMILFSMVQCSESKQSSETGESIYRKYCVTCHGIKGDLKTNGAIDLNHSVLGLDERVLVITEGRNTMTSFRGTLTDEQIKMVAQFTMGFTNEKSGSEQK
ncbi:MAG: cytochrome c [Saprospiraceae bacterium]|nr:cytochrome c [Saprospiraceae bacterium]MBK7811061.1 cytochrome c [Saprospiraceae bacterium]MBK9630665.1 cytochrome c [Saprospiraceae bacterium]